MKKKLLYFMGVLGTIYSAAPSKLIAPAVFYSQDFQHQQGMKYISLETKIGIIGDEVYVGRPRLFVNDNMVMCDCGKEAVNISFKKGDLNATCYECGPKKEPINQVKFGNPEKKANEINGKK